MSKHAWPVEGKYVLRLYVNDSTPQSAAAVGNLKRLCEAHLAGRYHIEVIDLVKNPRRAQDDQILAVPTLVRELPSPLQRFVGDLSHPEGILVDFDLHPHEADSSAAWKGEMHV